MQLKTEIAKSTKMFVISAPSGAGKNSIAISVLEHIPQLKETVSCTTRQLRTGEVPGQHYYFISPQEFEKKIAQNEFLEWAKVHDNYYGTLRSEVEQIRKEGFHVLLILDVQGYSSLRKIYPEVIGIFVTPPSLEVLKERLKKRGSENESDLTQRLKNAQIELNMASQYAHVVVNDTLVTATAKVEEIILSSIGAN